MQQTLGRYQDHEGRVNKMNRCVGRKKVIAYTRIGVLQLILHDPAISGPTDPWNDFLGLTSDNPA